MNGLLLGTYALRRMIASDTTLTTWLAAQSDAVLHVSSVSVAVLGAMAEAIPDAERRREWTERVLSDIPIQFGERMLPFERRAAHAWSVMPGRVVGENIDQGDLYVVATGMARGLDYVAPRCDWHGKIPRLRQHDPWAGTTYLT